MEDDALLDQFSMTFDLLPLHGQDSKNDDALLEQFSMNFDLSPLATKKDEETEEEKANKKQKMGNKRVYQKKKTKKEMPSTESEKEAEDEVNQKANKGKRTISPKSVEGIYVCNICHKDLGKRKSENHMYMRMHMHMRIKHKMTWKGTEHGLDEIDFEATKVKCEKNEADDKEADNENTKTKEEEETENGKVQDQKIPNKNEKEEAKKVKLENDIEEEGRSEENKADIKKENVSTFLDKTQKVAEDRKKKERKWKKGIEGVYICSICTEDLGNRFNIRNHMKRKHNTLWKPEKKKATKKIKSEIKTENDGDLSQKTEKTDVTKKKNKKKKNEFQEGIHWKLDQSKKGDNYTENAWVNVKKENNTKIVNTLKIEKKLKQKPRKGAKGRKWKKGKIGVYICTLCDKDNGNKFNLQYHMKTNHNEIWQQERDKRLKKPRWKKGVAGFFICEFCEKDCGNRNNLLFHRKTKHHTEWQQIKIKNINMEKKKVDDKEKEPHNVAVQEERKEKKDLQNDPKSIKMESRFTLQVPRSRPLSPLKPRTKEEDKEKIMGSNKTLNQILKKTKKTISPAPPKLSIQDKTEPDALPCYACLACYEKDCVDCVWCSGKKTGRRTNKCLTNKCLNPVPRYSMQEKEPLTLMEGQPFAFCPLKRNRSRRNSSSEKADTDACTDEQWSDLKLQTKFDQLEEEKSREVISISSHVQLNKEEAVSLEETDLATSILASQYPEESSNNEVEVDTPNHELNFEGSHQLKANESTSQKYSPNVSYDAPSLPQDQDTSIENSMNVECAEEYITFSNSGAFTEDSSQTLEEQGNAVHENQTETQEFQENFNSHETNEFSNVEEVSPHDSKSSLAVTEGSTQFIAAENLQLPKTGDSLVQELEPQKKNEDMENTHLSEKSLTEDANQPSHVSVNESSGTYRLCRAEDGSLYVLKS